MHTALLCVVVYLIVSFAAGLVVGPCLARNSKNYPSAK